MKLLECSETTEKIISSLFTNRVGLARLLSPQYLHTTYIMKKITVKTVIYNADTIEWE